MAIDINGFGMGGASGGAPSKFYFERFEAGSAGVISNISSAANNTPSRSVMTHIASLDGPGVLHMLAVFGNGCYTSPSVYNTTTSDVSEANSHARLQIVKDEETVIRKGANLAPMETSRTGTAHALITSNVLSAIGNSAETVYYLREPSVRSGRLENTQRSFGSLSSIHSAMYENAHELVVDGVLDQCTTHYPGGLYFEDKLDVYICFGSSPVLPSDPTYKISNGIYMLYELFD